MKIFIDSTDIREISHYHNIGVIDGVTTNPTLMAQTKGDFSEIVRQICKAINGKGDVSIEAVATEFSGIIAEGKQILSIAPNIVLKLPMTLDGLKACRHFANEGHKVNMTLCFSVNQALLAAKMGAKYISPFVGRLEDAGEDGIGLLHNIKTTYNHFGWSTQILAASIRTTKHVELAALCGVDAITLPPKIIAQLVHHNLTEQGLNKFIQDWNNSSMIIPQ